MGATRQRLSSWMSETHSGHQLCRISYPYPVAQSKLPSSTGTSLAGLDMYTLCRMGGFQRSSERGTENQQEHRRVTSSSLQGHKETASYYGENLLFRPNRGRYDRPIVYHVWRTSDF